MYDKQHFALNSIGNFYEAKIYYGHMGFTLFADVFDLDAKTPLISQKIEISIGHFFPIDSQKVLQSIFDAMFYSV